LLDTTQARLRRPERTQLNLMSDPLALNSIQGRFDPEAELNKAASSGGEEGNVHLRIQKRSGKKSLTIVQGLSKEQANHALKRLRKKLCCNGTVVTDETFGTVVQLQGDQREAVKAYLIQRNVVPANHLKVHGY